MKNNHRVKRIDLSTVPIDKAWDNIEEVSIDNFLWEDNNYTPKTNVKLFYTDTHLHISFKSYEEQIRIQSFNMNDDVYKDSCVEFFVNPDPENSDKYLNFEMNSVGALLLGLGKDRYEREAIVISNFREYFDIKTSVTKENLDNYNGKCWSVQYSIPFEFFEQYFGKLNFSSGYRLEANFYKCGDETKYPHYGCWNKLLNVKPDFHKSEFFGDLILS